MITKRTFLSTTLAGVMALGLGTPGMANAEELKIGVLLPITGPLSFVGGTMKESVDLLVEQYQAQGGIAGKPFSVHVFDTESNNTLVGQHMRRLIESEGVTVVLGPTVTGETLVARPVANELEVPLLPFAGTTAVTEPPSPWLFTAVPSDAQVAKAMVDLAKAQGHSKIGFLYSADGFGQTGLKVLTEIAKAESVELASVEEFGPRDADMTPQIMRIRSSEAEVLFVWGVNPGPTIIMRNARQLGFNKPIFNSYGVASQQFIDQAGPTAEGSYVAATAIMGAKALPEDHPIRQTTIGYIDAFEAKYGHPVAAFNGYVFDSFKALELALAANGGDTTPAAIADALRKVSFAGANGNLAFKEGSSTAQSPDNGAIIMLKIEGGKFVPAQ